MVTLGIRSGMIVCALLFIVKLMHLPLLSVIRIIASWDEFIMFNNADENPIGDTIIPRVFLDSFDKVPISSRRTVGPTFLDKLLH